MKAILLIILFIPTLLFAKTPALLIEEKFEYLKQLDSNLHKVLDEIQELEKTIDEIKVYSYATKYAVIPAASVAVISSIATGTINANHYLQLLNGNILGIHIPSVFAVILSTTDINSDSIITIIKSQTKTISIDKLHVLESELNTLKNNIQQTISVHIPELKNTLNEMKQRL